MVVEAVASSATSSEESPTMSSNDAQQKYTKPATAGKRTGGVADYFAILGVGEDLIWKYAQKQQEQQQQQQEMQQLMLAHSGESQQQDDLDKDPMNATASADPVDIHQEDQAALMERFYREIIDVDILTEEQYHSIAATATTSMAPSAIVAAPSMIEASLSTDTADGSLASSRLRGAATAISNDTSLQPHVLLPSPSSHSEATTIATTVLSSEHAPATTTTQPPPASAPTAAPLEKNGFTLVSRTLPPQRGYNNPQHPLQAQAQQQQHPLSTSFHAMDTPMSCQSVFPWNQNNTSTPHHQYHHPAGQHNNNRAYIFDANLDPVGGLRDQVCSTVLQWEESSNTGSDHQNTNNAYSGTSSSVGGSSAASLQGLKRKFWKRWQKVDGSAASGPTSTTTISSRSGSNCHKFYLGYKRRTPDREHVPAIANVALYYVGIPGSATLHPTAQHRGANSHLTTSSSPGGLVGRVAVAGHVLLERYRSQGPDPRRDPLDVAQNIGADSTSTIESTFLTVELKSKLPLPDGYDEWCIPEEYQQLNIPKSCTRRSSELHRDSNAGGTPQRKQKPITEKTVLVASPAHGNMRRRIPKNDSGNDEPDLGNDQDDDHISLGSQEAVEAYVEGNASFTLPASPVKPVATSPSTQDQAGLAADAMAPTEQEVALFVPQLLTDVQMEHDEAADLMYIPILAIRRQRMGEEERFHEDAAIVDLAVSFCDKNGIAILPDDLEDEDDIMNDGEEVFTLLSKTSWLEAYLEANPATNGKTPNEYIPRMLKLSKPPDSTKARIRRIQKSLGSPTILARRNVPFGFADQAFATSVLDRFPVKNYKGLPLPSEELPMFCYPTGCRLHRARFSDAPLSQYYGFVVKNERGDSIYVSCVSFMEPLARSKVDQLASMSEKRRRTMLAHRRFCEKRDRRRQNRTSEEKKDSDSPPHNDRVPGHIRFEDESDDDEDDNLIVTGFDTMTTFENKTICLVSRYPFWTPFRRFLSHLHILSGSSSDLPLERCISHLLLSVPLPQPGGASVIVPLPALNQPMVLSLPPLKDFPLVDLPFHRLVACLDIPTIVTVVLGFLALERKVILMSSRPSLVLDDCELLRSLLFPFELAAPYVPRLTEPFMSCLEFPGAIFVGIHDDGSREGLATVVRRSPPEDSIIIDLDSGRIECNRNRYDVLTSVWDLIPSTPRSMLVSELETLCRDAGIVPGQEPLESLVDSAFDAALPSALVEDFDVVPENQSREPLDDRAVRDAFLRFFCAVLRGYERFLVVPDVDFLISGNEWFDAQEFLATAPKETAGYLSSLVSTQLFQSFIQRRTEASDVHCLLFDECLAEYHSSPMPYGRLGGDVEAISSPGYSQPQMLYSLLVDQSSSAPYNNKHPAAQTNTSSLHDHLSSADGDSSKFGEDSDCDSTSFALAKPSLSTTTDISEKVRPRKLLSDRSDGVSIKCSESTMNASGDIITAPSRQNLPTGIQFIYCVDGNPCFPQRLNKNFFLPPEPDSLLVEMSMNAPSPLLARSEREVDEANRRRKAATSYRGFQTQKRCLWQLPKLMGSHFLGSWLLCIPAQVSQPDLSEDQQSRFLLRALGALRLLRHKQRIVPDEASYRALMVACGRTASDRRVELVKLFGLLRSDGIFPSAMTLGQYTRALAEGYSKRTTSGMHEDHNDFGTGVEVTESMDGHVNLARGTSVGSRISMADPDAALCGMDGNIFSLELQGRKWRQRNITPSDRANPTKTNTKRDATPFEVPNASGAEDRHKRRSHRSWLPVLVSSSFAPKTSTGWTSSRRRRSSISSRLDPENVLFVALWSRTCACDGCGYVVLDEEVQAGWDLVEGDSEVLGAISCPRCDAMIIPMLGFREMSVEQALAMKEPSPQNTNFADFAGLPPQVGPCIDPGKNKASFVTYISPATLRLSLERCIVEIGEEVLSRERLKELDPELFYNLWWYCARFSLPLPLPVPAVGEAPPKHYCAFAAWDRTAAERGCYSGAVAASTLFSSPTVERLLGYCPARMPELGMIDPFDEFPLLGRFNLQGFYPTVWDHSDLSEILVALVDACDRRDFKVVVERVLKCNLRRREAFGEGIGDNGSDANSSVDPKAHSDAPASPSVELDCYKTILYLAKYQCTTAFHTFFPAIAKPCKGYHFWCAIGTPLPIFDRLLRDAVQKVNSKDNNNDVVFAPIPDVSDVALGFRCVFGHLI